MAASARFPFRWKLTLFAAALSVAPLIGVGWLLIDVNAQAIETSSRHLQVAIVEDVARTVESELGASREGLAAVARALVDQELPEDARVQLVERLVEADPALEAVTVYDASGRAIDSIREEHAAAARMPEELPPTLRPEEGGAIGMVEVVEGVARAPVVVPIRPVDRVTGWVGTLQSLEGVQARVERLGEAHLAPGASVFVVDEELRTIASSDPERAASLADARAGILRGGDPRTLGPGIARSGEFEDDGRAMVGSVVGLRTYPWAVVVQIPRDVAYATLGEMRRIVIVTVAVTVVLALLVALLASRRITAPIEKLVSFARDLAARRFDRKVETGTGDELAVLGEAMSAAAAELGQSERRMREEIAIRADLGRYLPSELVEKVVRREQDMALGGRRSRVTVLFADVVAFTPLSEKLPPEDVVTILNELFTVVTEIVFRHGGTVDKFVGDCVMAIWGAPREQPDHAQRALMAAEDMLRLVEAANAGWQQRFGATAQLAIGINTGDAVVGNVGSETRMEYTAIGDAVNVAARLETIARPSQILIAESTRSAAGDGFDYVEIGAREMTGRAEPVVLFEVRP